MKSSAFADHAEIADSCAEGGLLAFILAENRNDVMSLGMFAYYVSRHPASKECPLRPTVLRYLENALAAGLLSVGDMIGTLHRPWNVSYTAALGHIEAAWPVGSDSTFNGLRDICWLANTAKGNQAAELRAYRLRQDDPPRF